MQIYAYDIEKLVPDDLRTSFKGRSKYKPTKFSDAGRHLMEVVHGIPDLLHGVSLGEVVIYIGRSYYNPENLSQGVYGRFKDHLKTKGLEYGIVALNCDAKKVPLWEKAAIRLIKNLKDNKKLCVSDIVNESSGSNGRTSSQAEAVIYIAWSTGRKTKIQYPTPQQIDNLSEQVFDELGGEIPLPQIKNVLLVTAKTDQALDIAWGNDLENLLSADELEDNHNQGDDDSSGGGELKSLELDSVGSLTVNAAIACGVGVREIIQKVTRLSSVQVQNKLKAAPGNTHVRNVFLDRWPQMASSDDAKIERIGNLTVSECRGEYEFDISKITGISRGEVENILYEVNGNLKIRNAFDRWPQPKG